MNNTPNSIGRGLVDSGYTGNGSLQASCRWRAIRDATRVLLASILYRSAHGGKLPATTDGFLPYLGAWPQDPYNGNPMIYRPSTEKVYAVGENLKDDGGDVGTTLSKTLDVGLSLKR